MREAVVAAREAFDRHNRQARPGRPISQDVRGGIDQSYVNRARHAPPRRTLIWEEFMPRLVGFSRFAALLEEQIGEKISQPTLHERRLNSSLRLLSARRGPLQAGGRTVRPGSFAPCAPWSARVCEIESSSGR